MKQQVFIIIGAIIVLFLILVWAYLLFFGTPQTAEDVFSELGLSGSDDNTVIIPPVIEEVPVVNMERPKLRQLTTKQVAGFREISTTNNTQTLYYVEMGTGHIFSINMETGEEVRLSGTTIPRAYKAEISPKGDFVAVASLGNSKNMPLVLGELSTSSDLKLTDFNKTVRNFSINENNELTYSVPEGQGLSGYSYQLKTKVSQNLFTIPFIEANILWNKEKASNSHYIYPMASYALEGFLYEVSGSKLVRLPVSGFGFSAKVNEDIILFNSNVGQAAISYVYNRETGDRRALDAVVLPEKCYLPTTGTIFICGHEAIKVPYEFPDSWYQGETSYKDSLYAISATEFTSELLVNTFTESGREIDTIDMQSSISGSEVYFINKNNNSLWMYEF